MSSEFRVVPSMNAFIGVMYTPLPMCASGILEPAAFSSLHRLDEEGRRNRASHSYSNLKRNPPCSVRLGGNPHHEPAKVFLKDVNNGLWHMMGLQRVV